MAENDLLAQLPRPSWRGIEFPIQGERQFSFDHDDQKIRILFRDDQLIESLGRTSPTYTYSIPFREGIARHWVHAFTEIYPRFLEACLDRSRGDLFDPLHGVVPAKCTQFSEVLSMTKRDGVDVQVSFVKAPLQDEIATPDPGAILKTLFSAHEAAGAFDRQVKIVHWQQEQPPEPTLNIFDAVTGIGNQLEATEGRFQSAMDDLAFRMEKTDATIRRLKDPSLEPLRRSARRLNLAARRLHESSSTPPNPTMVVRVVGDVGLVALALAYGLTPAELIAQNPGLARQPRVRSGTRIRVRKRSPFAPARP